MNHAMKPQDLSLKPMHVACAVCMKEIPLSDAVVPEAKDYVAHFCGLDCYQKWRQQADTVPPEKTA
jgi:hypothetical protein